MPAPSPLRLLLDLHKYLSKPARLDAKRDQAVFPAAPLARLRTRLRNCIAAHEKQEDVK